MHKININLHNLKTALIFSIEISTWFTYVPNYIIFRRSAAEIRGGGIHPPPPGCEIRSKDPAFLGLSLVLLQVCRLGILYGWAQTCANDCSGKERGMGPPGPSLSRGGGGGGRGREGGGGLGRLGYCKENHVVCMILISTLYTARTYRSVMIYWTINIIGHLTNISEIFHFEIYTRVIVLYFRFL